jgi:hypothetical protein
LRIGEGRSLAELDIDRGNINAAEAAQRGSLGQGLLNTGLDIGSSILGKALGLSGVSAAATTAATALTTAAGLPTALGAELAGLASIAQSVGPGSAALNAAQAGAIGAKTGLSSAITGFLTNPWTIGIGAALAVGSIIWKKSQAHPKADELVQTWQNPYHENSLAPFHAQWDAAVKSGQVTQQQGYAALDQYLQNYEDYLNKITEWAGDNGDKKTVANQSANHLWNSTVGVQVRRMQNEIRQLPQEVAA